MGPMTWLFAGLAAGGTLRLVSRNSVSRTGELLVALLFGFGGGLLATALDFGGWSELDWRAITFAFFVSASSIALLRISTFAFRSRTHEEA